MLRLSFSAARRSGAYSFLVLATCVVLGLSASLPLHRPEREQYDGAVPQPTLVWIDAGHGGEPAHIDPTNACHRAPCGGCTLELQSHSVGPASLLMALRGPVAAALPALPRFELLSRTATGTGARAPPRA